MRKLLNVLYVTSPDGYLSRDGQNVVVRIASEEKARIPIHILESIVCFAYIGASPALMGLCAESGVAVSFLAENGKFLARLSGPTTGNVLLRRQQYRLADDVEACAVIVRNMLSAKVANSRTVLRRAMRDHGDSVDMKRLHQAVNSLDALLRTVTDLRDLDTLRGLEGHAAHVYFSTFDELILNRDPAFRFEGRNRRPPRDAVN